MTRKIGKKPIVTKKMIAIQAIVEGQVPMLVKRFINTSLTQMTQSVL